MEKYKLTFIDATFDDIEWNYGQDENNKVKEDNRELVETNMKLAIKNKELEKENEKLNAQVGLLDDNRIYLNNKIDKAIEYVHNHQLVFRLYSIEEIQEWFEKEYYVELLKILENGEEND